MGGEGKTSHITSFSVTFLHCLPRVLHNESSAQLPSWNLDRMLGPAFILLRSVQSPLVWSGRSREKLRWVMSSHGQGQTGSAEAGFIWPSKVPSYKRHHQHMWCRCTVWDRKNINDIHWCLKLPSFCRTTKKLHPRHGVNQLYCDCSR